MKISNKGNNLRIDGTGDFIVSKYHTFDVRELTLPESTHILNFSGSSGYSKNTIPHLAKFLGYTKLQVACFKLLCKLFNKKFEYQESSFIISAENE